MKNENPTDNSMSGKIRSFGTGATRDSDVNKPDYEGFIDPLVLEVYGEYMTKHRKQSDGQLRDSDNWQKGIPIAQYMKSKLRHIIHTWKIYRGHVAYDEKGVKVNLKESLCAELFNTMGYLHELIKEESK